MTTELQSDIHQFADDTNIHKPYTDPIQAVQTINNDLSHLQHWADQWRVTFNPSKTHFINFTLKKSPTPLPPITFYNKHINKTPSLQILGVTLTSSLSWNEHVLKQIKKASKRLFILKKFQYILPRKALIHIYTAMIRPILEFGDVIYDQVSAHTSQALETIQRQAAIACTGAYRHTSHNKLLAELGWEHLHTRRHIHKLCLFYKIYHQIYPPYLHNFLTFNTPSQYNLRTQRTLVPRHTRLSITQNSFFPYCTREWNKLTPTVQNSISVHTFKSLISTKIITNKQYNTLCTGTPGKWLSRLRMELSALNSHRHKYNFINSPICPTCRTHSETTKHYLFTCPTHRLARNLLLDRLDNELGLAINNLDTLQNTILFGINISPLNYKILLDIVYQYLISTGRFI